MSDWRIHSPRNLDWQCHLADCDEEHAHSVMATLTDDPTCPDYLELECLDPEPKPAPEPNLEKGIDYALNAPVAEPQAEPVPEPRKRRFWRKG